MNQQRYRILFNKARGQLMAVSETATSQGKDSARGETPGASPSMAGFFARLPLMKFALYSLFGLVTVLPFSLPAQAQISADPNAPRNQQPTILPAGNGVPVVNIQTPSAAGVSRNTYQQFDVNGNGAILNNSRTNVQTQQGGWVQGNPWLANGSARVILNEVNSSNPSQLRGYVEVAGQRAQVIIANPAGITCDGCGFINANQATLTTGIPIFNNGNLESYRVTGGNIVINGAGLDATQTDYTQLIARAVQVNAGIWANQLTVVAGANEVSAIDAAPMPGSGVNPISSDANKPAYAIDVAQLGGMYAGKITLIGTEAGVGVRNAGNIGASAGEVVVTADGRLQNSGAITSITHLQLNTQNGLSNSGTLYADQAINVATPDSIQNGGSIRSANLQLNSQSGLSNTGTLYATQNLNATVQGTLNNAGLIGAAQDVTLVAQNGASGAGQLLNAATGTSVATLAAGLQPDSSTAPVGNLTLRADDTFQSGGQLIAGQTMNWQAAHLALTDANVQAHDLNAQAQDIRLSGSRLAIEGQTNLHSTHQAVQLAGTTLQTHDFALAGQNINLDHATINTAGQTTLTATGELSTQSARITANKLTLTAQSMNNSGGELVQIGHDDLNLSLSGDLNNTDGRIAANSNAHITAQNLINAGGELSFTGALSVNAQNLNNQVGLIQSGGDQTLRVAQTLDNSTGTLIAQQALTLSANNFNNTDGQLLHTGTAPLTIAVTNELNNTRGQLQSNSHPVQLTAQSLNNRSGVISAVGELNLNTVTLTNQSGTISADTLTLQNAQSIDNRDGVIGGDHALSITTQAFDNSQQGQAGSSLGNFTLNATQINNQQGQLYAANALTLTSGALDNTQGKISADSLTIDAQNQALTNTAGSLTASHDVRIDSGALNNDAGLIQAGGALTLDTHGQTLTNTNSGHSAGILSTGDVTLATAQLNNQTGFIGSNHSVNLNASTLNNHAGIINANGDIGITANQIDNQSAGQILALQDVTLNATDIHNDQGQILALQTLTIHADTLTNTRTRANSDALANQGLTGADILLTVGNLDNSTGVISADRNLSLKSSGTLNNNGGLIVADGQADVGDIQTAPGAVRTLAIQNDSGTMLTGEALRIAAARYTGTGDLQSFGDLTLDLQSDYTHTGQIQGMGNVNVSTTGTLTNQSLIEAGNVLTVNANNIDNTVQGELNGSVTHLVTHTLSGQITNRGLIDGSLTWLEAGQLNNLGTGRIYGDAIAIQTGQLTNTSETIPGQNNGLPQAAVIAAREDLQIGAANLLNRDHALIFSSNTLGIGSTLDQDRLATGQATQLTNYRATIESLGNMNLSVRQIQNTGDYATAEIVTSNEHHLEYYDQNTNPDINPNAWDYNTAGNAYITYGSRNDLYGQFQDGHFGRVSTEFDIYDYTRTVTETQLVSSDPGLIQAGGNLTLTTDQLTNQQSKVLAGQTLKNGEGGSSVNIRNSATTGQITTTKDGTHVAVRNQSNNFGNPDTYQSTQTEDIDLGLSISRIGNTDAGSNTQINGRTSSSINNTLPGPNSGTLSRTGSLSPIIEIPLPGNNQVIRTTVPTLTFPDNSLFHLNPALAGSSGLVGNGGPSSHYLIETDPRFANYRDWLSSDTLIHQLGLDQNLLQKRLGDGFYEQKLVREQIANLTGMRFLEGYSNDEEQYRALLNNGATFAKDYGLIPGVSLSAEQMALLTSDIVWLVEQTVTLPDGTTTQALVPQVYAKVQPGDITGGGSLMSARNIQLKLSGDLSNNGTIAARNTLSIAAQNITQTGGRIRAATVSLQADNDIRHNGGMIDAQNAMMLNAGRDIVIASQTATHNSSNGSTTNISRIASVQVGGQAVVPNKVAANTTNSATTSGSLQPEIGGSSLEKASNPDAPPNGLLIINAGRNATLTSADIQNNAQGGQTLIAAKNDLTLNTVTTSTDVRFGAGDNHQYFNRTDEVGSSVKTQGSLTLIAGNDLNARAAQINAGGNLGIGAGHDINITAGQNSRSADTADHASSSGFMSKSSVTRESQTEEHTLTGSTFKTGGSLTLQAGNDLNITASKLAAQGDASLTAGHNLTVTEGRQTSLQNRSEQDSKSNFGQSSSDAGQSHVYADKGLSSSVQGNTVTMTAGNDLTVRQSSVIGTEGVALTAIKGDVMVTAGQNYYEADSSEQHKSSGFNTFAGQGGFGVSYDKNKSNGEGHVIAVTQSDARSTIGATNGNVIVTAGKDATFIGSDVVAGRKDDNPDVGHISVKAQNVSILAGEDHVTQSSANSSQSSGIGVAIVGTSFDTVRNLQKAGQNDSKVTAGRQISEELANAGLTDTQIAATAHHNKSSSQSQSESITHSGSSFTSAGDTILRATGDGQKEAQGVNVNKALNGDILIEGSQLSAGERLKLDADRNVTIQASTDTHTESSSSKSSGWRASTAVASLGDVARFVYGDPNNSGVSVFPLNTNKTQGSADRSATTQNASVLIGHEVDVTSRTGDIRIAGSGIQAAKDITLTATQGQIDILSGQESQRQTSNSSVHQTGDLGGTGYSGTVGIRNQSHSEEVNATSQNTVRSQLNSSEGSITMTAKNDINARGADMDAARDVTLIGRNVNLDPAQDSTQARSQDKSSQYGVTLALSGYAVQAAQAAENAVRAHEDGKSDEVTALYGVQAALALANATGAGSGGKPASTSETGNPGNSNGSNTIIKATVSVGGGSSQASSHSASTMEQGTTVKAGGKVSIIARGSGTKDADGYASDGDIHARGAQISGANVSLNAARDVVLESAQDTSSLDRRNRGSSASMGVGFGLGGTQNGFTIELAASTNKGKADGESTTNRNTHITASDTLSVTSGRDTNIAGAQVAGNTVKTDIGRDLNIASRQDTDNYHSKEESGGAQVSLCIPPFCYGQTVSASGNYSGSKTDSTYASVVEQSGIYAGSGGYNIKVKGNTDLTGAVMASTATSDKNRLETGTLTTRDIENHASYNSDSTSIALSYSGGTSGASGINWGADAGLAKSAAGSVMNTAAANAQGAQTGDANGTTQSAISSGTIVITNSDAQKEKTGQTAEETIASLNRDTTNANGSIDKIFDEQKIKDEKALADLRAQTMQQAAPLLYNQVGNLLQGQNEAVKTAVHALIGGLVSKALGGEFGSGAAGVAAGHLAVLALDDQLKGMDISPDNRAALLMSVSTVVAGAVGTAAGGSTSESMAAGATSGLATTYNYLSHPDAARRKQLEDQRAACKPPSCSAEDKARMTDEINALNQKDLDQSRALRSACDANRNSSACMTELAKAEIAKDSFSGTGMNGDTSSALNSSDFAYADAKIRALNNPNAYNATKYALGGAGLLAGGTLAFTAGSAVAGFVTTEVGTMIRFTPLGYLVLRNNGLTNTAELIGDFWMGNPNATTSLTPSSGLGKGGTKNSIIVEEQVGNGARPANSAGIGFDGYDTPAPKVPDAPGAFRPGQTTNISEHLIDEMGITQGKHVYGTHERDNFMRVLQQNGGTVIGQPKQVAEGIYEIEYQLANKTSTAKKTVFDSAVYPIAEMEKMAQSAAQKAINVATSTGQTGILYVDVGGLRWQVPVNPDRTTGLLSVPTAFPIGVAPWPK